MALKDVLERRARVRQTKPKLPNLERIVEHFNSSDIKARISAMDEWSELVLANPGNLELLKYLPKIVGHFNDINSQVNGAALDAWKAAAKANPQDDGVLAHLPKVVSKFRDPDELVRYAAISAWETAAKLSPAHEMVEQTKKTYEAEQMKT
jgi:hypothetical protein